MIKHYCDACGIQTNNVHPYYYPKMCFDKSADGMNPMPLTEIELCTNCLKKISSAAYKVLNDIRDKQSKKKPKRRLTKTFLDGSFGVADDLPCGENSYDFKTLLINTLGYFEENMI
jgi:hypothetical protein